MCQLFDDSCLKGGTLLSQLFVGSSLKGGTLLCQLFVGSSLKGSTLLYVSYLLALVVKGVLCCVSAICWLLS